MSRFQEENGAQVKEWSDGPIRTRNFAADSLSGTFSESHTIDDAVFGFVCKICLDFREAFY